MYKRIKSKIKNIVITNKFAFSALREIFLSEKQPKGMFGAQRQKDSILIFGGGLNNTGAQAMTFTVVSRMRRMFPEKNIYLFSDHDYRRSEAEKTRYVFTILPWSFRLKLTLLRQLRLGERKTDTQAQMVGEVFCKTFLSIDISGYALSSQWGFLESINYILNIILVRLYSIPLYIFPQSIGPFDYRGWEKMVLLPLLKRYLQYPKKIYVREDECLEHLNQLSQKNVERSNDIVFGDTRYENFEIYRHSLTKSEASIPANSVGLIPNVKIVTRENISILYELYTALIKKILKSNKNVVLLQYSQEDMKICTMLKGRFAEDIRVTHVTDNFDPQELEFVMQQFELVIVSRYHAIVHALKNSIPVLVLAWSDKYASLLKEFNQESYLFDVRGGMRALSVLSALDRLLVDYHQERAVIERALEHFNRKNTSDIFEQFIPYATAKDAALSKV